MKKRRLLLALILFFTIGFAIFGFYHFKADVPISKNGLLVVEKENFKKGFIALEGDFFVYDGLYDDVKNCNVTPKKNEPKSNQILCVPKRYNYGYDDDQKPRPSIHRQHNNRRNLYRK